MHSSILREIINWASMPALAVLAGMLIWRKAFRKFPYFFNYIIVGELIVIVRLCLYDPYSRVYFYAYWTTDLLIAIAAVLAVYELFVRRLFPRFHSVRFYQYLFPTAAVLIALIAAPAVLQLKQIWIIIQAIHVLRVFRAAMFAFFFGLMVFMGRQWGRYEFGIAAGLGLQDAAQLVTSASWTQNSRIHVLTTQLPVISYDIACLIWLITFARSDKARPVIGAPVSPEILEEAQQWKKTLKGSWTGKKRNQ